MADGGNYGGTHRRVVEYRVWQRNSTVGGCTMWPSGLRTRQRRRRGGRSGGKAVVGGCDGARAEEGVGMIGRKRKKGDEEEEEGAIYIGRGGRERLGVARIHQRSGGESQPRDSDWLLHISQTLLDVNVLRVSLLFWYPQAFLQLRHMEHIMDTNHVGWKLELVCDFSPSLQNLVWPHKAWCQLAFCLEAAHSPERSDTKVHIISYFKSELPSAVISITLLPRQGDSQSDVCQRVKVEQQRPVGLLLPLQIPEWKWEEIGMDFITGLPRTTSGHDSIWVVVDRLTKVAHFIPVNTTNTGKKLAELYLARIMCLHGVLKKIVSDRGSQFTSKFWQKLQEELGTRLNFSTAYYPQTDGQTERVNQILEDILPACALDFGGAWDKSLPYAEFSYNNSYQASLQMAIFKALYGQKCRTPLFWDQTGERQLFGTEELTEA
uniref:Retrotransposon protein, putative, Ty3-gypsy subclass n=1 Tax=Oryza sativa subsp. japonica TaxID=39947 RepID=Q2QU12_ORYSJ|nr:retrotransposon protein, putative, Ty3-gypsy subclass [Oryza sativa Japonica Group]